MARHAWPSLWCSSCLFDRLEQQVSAGLQVAADLSPQIGLSVAVLQLLNAIR